MADENNVFELPADELERRVDEFLALVASEFERRFGGLVELTQEDRERTDGKFRKGEHEVLEPVLDLADDPKFQGTFEGLADKDAGADPTKFETQLLRDRLRRHKALSRLLAGLEAIGGDLSDSLLYLGELSRPILLAAYQTAKPIARSNDAVRSKIAKTLDFYRGPAVKAAKTRAAKKA
jgi:hypothetical protein